MKNFTMCRTEGVIAPSACRPTTTLGSIASAAFGWVTVVVCWNSWWA